MAGKQIIGIKNCIFDGLEKVHLPENKKDLTVFQLFNPFKSRPAGARTLDPLIKSQLLCQLSYRPYILKNNEKLQR